MASEDIFSQAPPPADARIAYGSDPQQFFDLRLPKIGGIHSVGHTNTPDAIPSGDVKGGHPERSEPQADAVEGSAFPLALFIHGGFWRSKYDLTHAGHLCAALTKAGIATTNIEYRRVGNPGGGWPGSLHDIEAAFNFISNAASKHGLDLSRTVVIGHSAGGHLALALSPRRPSLRGVVALAPVSHLRHAYDLHLSNDAVVEFLGGPPSKVPATYAEASPAELRITMPQLIIHGTHDDTVPFEMSRSYVETKRKQGENVRLLELDCGHFELIDPSSSAWAAVQQALLDLLKI
jgi:acetyl esterase/lipase